MAPKDESEEDLSQSRRESQKNEKAKSLRTQRERERANNNIRVQREKEKTKVIFSHARNRMVVHSAYYDDAWPCDSTAIKPT